MDTLHIVLAVGLVIFAVLWVLNRSNLMDEKLKNETHRKLEESLRNNLLGYVTNVAGTIKSNIVMAQTADESRLDGLYWQIRTESSQLELVLRYAHPFLHIKPTLLRQMMESLRRLELDPDVQSWQPEVVRPTLAEWATLISALKVYAHYLRGDLTADNPTPDILYGLMLHIDGIEYVLDNAGVGESFPVPTYPKRALQQLLETIRIKASEPAV